MDISIIILSVFCIGGLFAYIREFIRLRRLVSSGETAFATILETEEDRSASDSELTHYLVKYEFIDEEGHKKVHKQDLNSKRYFDTLKRGDTIKILYQPVSNDNSYPVAQIDSDLRINIIIIAAIIIFWVVMATFFALS